ncbi:MAG: hypothetical protein MRK02_06535 [Candidatus Scalindua sp.]|nr:hypothetical protein [Candidatus Scalindua sp.]
MTNIFVFGFLCLVISALLFKKRNNIILFAWSLICTIFIMELAALGIEYLTPKNNITYIDSPAYKLRDPELRYWQKPDMISDESKLLDGKMIFKDVRYTFDQKGRRVSLADKGTPSKHALFFGGSFTFGSGVPDSQTLPSYFQQLSDHKYKAYNYGACGFGPGEMFIQLGRDNFFEDINLPTGIAVYSFISDHLRRSTPYQINYFAERPRDNTPIFFSDDSHKRLLGPVKYSDINKLRIIVDMYQRISTRSPLFRFIAKRVPLRYTSQEQATITTAKIIIESKNRYIKRFNGDFYVLFWPRMISMKMNNKKILIDLLKKENIHVIEVPPMTDTNDSTIHPADDHPSPKEYRWVAECLNTLL